MIYSTLMGTTVSLILATYNYINPCIQAQAVNTGNRLLTPLIPPLMSTSLNVDKFRDTILGMFYGATIGDSLGLLTQNLTPDEAEFHYSRKTMDQTHLYKDEHRCEAKNISTFFVTKIFH